MGAFPRPEPMGKYLHLLMPALAMALLSRPAWAEELYGPVVPLAGNVGPVIEGEAFAVDGAPSRSGCCPFAFMASRLWNTTTPVVTGGQVVARPCNS
jgi:hypothetical protein